MRPRWSWRVVTLLLAVLLGVVAHPPEVLAQIDTIRMEVQRDFLGIGGVSRPGSFAAVRLGLINDGADNRQVLCRWMISDYDGDEVVAERAATLNPGRTQYVWLYAMPAVNASGNQPWTFQVVDRVTGEAPVTQRHAPPAMIPVEVGAIGVMGTAEMGLQAYAPQQPYSNPFTAHEPLTLIRGLALSTLPDRWYGLGVVHALVWTSEGGGPDDAAVTPAMQAALREWVRRGGHLVIVLPVVGEPWSGSGLKDLLPVTAAQMRRIEAPPPKLIYTLQSDESLTVGLTVFDSVEENGASVVHRDENGEALIVAKRYGFGRVTLVGADLTDRRLARLTVSSGGDRVWNTIFGWKFPVMLESKAAADIQNGNMTNPDLRVEVKLEAFVQELISMTGAVAPALLLAVVVFLLYFAVAGPISFAVLRGRKQAHLAWVAFVVVVAGFTAVTWGGAWLLRPRSTSIAHFSVMDVDAKTGEVRTQSWLSLFVPSFGRAEVKIAGGEGQSSNTLWNTGLFGKIEDIGFLDTQSYAIDAASPASASVPVRATAKQFTVNYVGRLEEGMPGVTHAWVPPQGSLRIDPTTNFPTGELRHALPGTLRNVLFVYVPPSTAANPTPWVWRVDSWPAEETLDVVAERAVFLVQRRNYDAPRTFSSEGHLGQLMGSGGLSPFTDVDPAMLKFDDFQRVKAIEMLSFYDLLPPPDFGKRDFANPPVSYVRSLGRGLDLSPVATGAKLIVIGHLSDSPLPLPLTVDGDAVPAEGRTVVRWIYDL